MNPLLPRPILRFLLLSAIVLFVAAAGPPTAGAPAVDGNTPAMLLVPAMQPVQGSSARCLAMAKGNSAGVPWIAVATVITAEGNCASEVALEPAQDCVVQVDDLERPDAAQLMADCLRGFVQGNPDLPSGVVTSGPKLMLNAALLDGSPAAHSKIECHDGFGFDPTLATGPTGAWDTFKAVIQWGAVVESFEKMTNARLDAAMEASNEEGYETAYPEDFQEALKDYELAVEAVAIEVPDPVYDKESITEQISEWIFDVFSDDDEGEGSEGGEGGEGTERGDPTADSAACGRIKEALEGCDLAGWATSPCQLLKKKLTNPDCDPFIAMTDGSEPCVTDEWTEPELEGALQESMIRCWALVLPGPGSEDVCSIRTTQGPTGYVIPGEACSDPAAMPEPEDCIGVATTPDEMVAQLLGTNSSDLLDLVLASGYPPAVPPDY